jgi:predicted protein tyrosine phosphatase
MACPDNKSPVLRRDSKVLCCCAGGKVRSVAAKYVLEDEHQLPNVLVAGLEKNGPETLDMLFRWADHILVVGDTDLLERVPELFRSKRVFLGVGKDRWGHYDHADLLRVLRRLIAELF